MKSLLFISVLTTAIVRGSEAQVPILREKLHAKLLEMAPPPAPPKPPEEGKEEAKPAEQTIVMKPVVVTESKLIQEVTTAIAREEQSRRDEKFSGFDGGTLFSIGGFKIGGWMDPNGGWTFLRLNKTPTPRQAAATEERLRDLYELAGMGVKRPPASTPLRPESPPPP